MARNQITVAPAPQTVWSVLADPPAYGQWVVGLVRICDNDAAWPAPGTRFHHRVGSEPIGVSPQPPRPSAERTATER